jgi:hypothetical protein
MKLILQEKLLDSNKLPLKVKNARVAQITLSQVLKIYAVKDA